MSKKLTQIERIATHLLKGNTLTPIQALRKFDCFRLAAVIYKLKKQLADNLTIQTEMIEHNGKRFAQYSVVKRKII